MDMYKKIGEFTPDSLFVSPDFPVLREGIGLKRGYGVLKRGSVIVRGEDNAGYIAGTVVSVGEEPNTAEMEMKVFGILADDTDTGSDAETEGNVAAVVYQTGDFNRGAVSVAAGASIDTYEDDLKGIGIYLRSVQNYE